MTPQELEALAVFYHDLGLHFPLQEKALPWFGSQHPGESRLSPSGAPSSPSPHNRAEALQRLREEMAAFDGCLLKNTAKNLVFSDGNPNAAIMLVGEAPGREEDLSGKPFVGRAGRLLNEMLKSIGLDRSHVYITNILPWRPPSNRTPTVEEQILYEPFVRRHISIIQPRLLICLGSVAAKRLLPIQKDQGILKARGQWLPFKMENGETILGLPTFHPAYLLRQPSQKRLSWLDLLLIKQKIASLSL